jgi:glycosyltransferase involved in cell wall biosynthesis
LIAPRRILLVNKFFYRKGGAETYLFELMAALQARGHEVIPFAMQHAMNATSDYARFFVDEVDYDQPGPWQHKLRAAGRIVYSVQARRQMAALLQQVQPEVAHLHNIYHQISPSILPVLHHHGVPVVMTLHDLKLVCPNYKMRTNGAICERCKPHRFYQAVVHRCVKDSYLASAVSATEMYVHHYARVYEKYIARFIAPSRFYLQKMLDWGIPAHKLGCMPYCIDVEQYLPLYEADDYFIYFGRLSDEKGLLTLLEAMRRLQKGKLVMVGDGPLRDALEEAVAACGLTNVHLTGPKWGAELADLIRHARFAVLPSEWYENCPLSIMESYACGTPVLGANIGGISEMVIPERTGLLFEPFNVTDLVAKLDYLLQHSALLVHMGRQARARAEQEYTPERHYADLMQVYTDVWRSRSAA